MILQQRQVSQLLSRRLHNQRLVGSALRDPVKVVGWLGAVQAQEYAVAKWALGLRATGLTDASVERAFADGRILRTHVMRPTWHFVAPADIRWMLALTGPRVTARMAPYNRQLELTPDIFSRSRTALGRALEGGKFLTRAELATVLTRRGIAASGQRLAHLMLQAELDQVICSGPRRGTLFTYALLAERAPRAKALDREASLAELARRFFRSHGPATLQDYVWWSGLTTPEARLGVELCGRTLVREEIGARTYWSANGGPRPLAAARGAWLLPIYDEYVNAYRQREAIIGERSAAASPPGSPHYLIVEGRLAGSWIRRAGPDSLDVAVVPYRPLSRSEVRQVQAAAESLGRFASVPVSTSIQQP